MLILDATGSMSDVVTALSNAITSSTLFSVVADLMPFLAVIVPCALGFYLLRKMIKGTGKAKVKI